MNLLAPAALALAAMAVPLVVLYMLRSRRIRREVSSTLLWERAGSSVTSAVPWKRLDITPLLLIQLAILGLAVFALARPFFEQASLLGPHTVFVIDSSGSMAAAGRFDAAVDEARRLAGDVSDARLVSIVDAGPVPAVAGSFMRTIESVEETLAGLRITGGPADLDAAIRLARGLATPDRPTNLVLLSDGGDAPLATEPVLDADHIRFTDTADNLSISGISVEPSSEGVVRLFVTVSNHTGVEQEVTLGVSVDGLPSGTTRLLVPPLGDRSTTVPVDAGPGQLVTVERQGEPDGLELDDTASVLVEGGAARTVSIMGEGSTFLEVLVDITPGFSRAPDADGDVLVVDGGPLPEIDRPTWLIRPATPPPGVEFAELVTNVGATYQAPGEPILDSVDLSDLAVSEAQVAETVSWLPIVRAGDVPLILLGDVDGHRVVYFTFDLTHSNLPVQVGFPIMGSRLLGWLGGNGSAGGRSAVAGTPIPLSPPAGASVEIRFDGELVAELGEGVVAFSDTGAPGIYEVSYVADGERHSEAPMIRTFARAESAAGSRQIEVVAPPPAVAGSGSLVREWGPSLVGLIVALMLGEWWLSHRDRSRRPEVLA